MRLQNKLQRATLCVAALTFVGAVWFAERQVFASGTISLTALDTPYTQNFDTLALSGTSSTVPTGWDFLEAGANANTTYTAGTGSSNTGDSYSFGLAASTDRAFGAHTSKRVISPLRGAPRETDRGAPTDSSVPASRRARRR